MKVAFDFTAGSFSHMGVWRYVHGLGTALSALGKPGFLPFAFTHHAIQDSLPGLLQRRIPHRVAATLGRPLPFLRPEALLPPYDLLHVPTPPPLPSAKPQVLTLHDLLWLRDPARVRAWLDSCRGVLCVSEEIAKRVRELHPDPKLLVSAVPPACSWSGPATGPSPEPFPYVFFGGSFLPAKNLERLVEAHSLLPKPKPLLVLAGGSAPLRDGVKVLPRLDDPLLHRYVTHARAALLPSLDEGFGFPILEAQICGTPVLASDLPALRETSGGAAIFANPLNVEDITLGLRRILDMSDGERCALVEMGMRNARRRSWADCARETWTFYEEVLHKEHTL